MACRNGQKYAGAYVYDMETDIVSGCPARAPSVHAVMDAIKTWSGAKGAAATWQHAKAMTIEDLQKIMWWSEKQCAHSLVDPKEVHTAQGVEELQFITKHGMMRVFSSSAFTLWTRYVVPLVSWTE